MRVKTRRKNRKTSRKISAWTPSKKEHIIRCVRKWSALLHLTAWTYSLNFDLKTHGEEATLAEVAADPVYLNAAITFYVDLAGMRPCDVEEVVLHELIHCVLADLERGREMPDKAYADIVERTTQTLTEIILRSA